MNKASIQKSIAIIIVCVLVALTMTSVSNVHAMTARKPIILVGGFADTKFFVNGTFIENDEIWFDEDRTLLDPFDSHLSPLYLTASGADTDSRTRTIRRASGYLQEDISQGLFTGIETLIHIDSWCDVWEGLIDELEDQGYVKGVNLFACPYDWRKDINTTYTALDEVIEIAKQKSGWSKVDIIAHSMGGLLTSRYLVASSTYRAKVDNFITIGTPYYGSVDAPWALTTGNAMNMFFGLIGVYSGVVKDMVKNFPGAYELFPSEKYFTQVINYNNGSNYTFNGTRYYSYIVENDKDFDGNGYKYDHLTFTQMRNAVRNRYNSNDMYYKNKQFHDVVDNVSLWATYGVKHHIIYGTGEATLYVMGVRDPWWGSMTFDELHFGDGDGTVPTRSAFKAGVSAQSYRSVYGHKHGDLPTRAPVIRRIQEILGLPLSSLSTEQEVEASGLQGTLILVKADEMPTIYRKSNPKDQIGPGKDYQELKRFIDGDETISKEDQAKLEMKMSAGSLEYISNTFAEKATMKRYEDIYVIHIKDKDDYVVRLNGTNTAAIELREFQDGKEITLKTINDINLADAAGNIEVECSAYTNTLQLMK